MSQFAPEVRCRRPLSAVHVHTLAPPRGNSDYDDDDEDDDDEDYGYDDDNAAAAAAGADYNNTTHSSHNSSSPNERHRGRNLARNAHHHRGRNQPDAILIDDIDDDDWPTGAMALSAARRRRLHMESLNATAARKSASPNGSRDRYRRSKSPPSRQVSQLPEPAPAVAPAAAATSSWAPLVRSVRTSIYIVLIIISLLLLLFLGLRTSQQPHNATADGTLPPCNFNALAADHPTQSARLWHRLQFGVREVFTKPAPQQAVYLFVQCAGDTSLGDLAADIAAEAHRCLHHTSANAAPPVRLGADDFNTVAVLKDYGHLVASVRPRLRDARVLLVDDVQLVAADSARALHFLCDGVQPPVDRSVVLLTMRLGGDRGGDDACASVLASSQTTLLAYVEQRLMAAWSTLGGNVFGPLVTRVTDQVLLVV